MSRIEIAFIIINIVTVCFLVADFIIQRQTRRKMNELRSEIEKKKRDMYKSML